MKWILAALTSLVASAALAGPLEDKARRLVEIQGVAATLQPLLDQINEQSKKDIAQRNEELKAVIADMMNRLNLGKDHVSAMKEAAKAYETAPELTTRQWKSAQALVDNYLWQLAGSFTEEELDQLIAFHGSNLGRKSASVGKAWSALIVEYYKSYEDSIRYQPYRQFMRSLALIAQDCNCPRSPPR
jgi:hypothetical protein